MMARKAERRSGTRIAMWSGPRNISTALMRSWGSRRDTVVCDEPLYAHYLQETKRNHPGRDEILAHHETDAEKVIDQLTGPIPDGYAIYYQKHMAHHLLPELEWDWILDLQNVFLIRNPREMLISLIDFIPDPQAEDTGLPQQWQLFQRVQSVTGSTPPVVRARDMLDNPRGMLTRLCESLEVPFDASMLTWEPGPRDTDGIWATYWYDAVNSTTGFQSYSPKSGHVPERLKQVHDECQTIYRKLLDHRLQT